jgi:hypothetical protein
MAKKQLSQKEICCLYGNLSGNSSSSSGKKGYIRSGSHRFTVTLPESAAGWAGFVIQGVD